MILIVYIRYRTIKSILYEQTKFELDDNSTDDEIMIRCLDHLSQVTTEVIANWYINELKNRKS